MAKSKLPLFPLGRIVATQGAMEAMLRADTDPGALLSRHNFGDWGDLPDDDKKLNEAALNGSDRIFSSYNVGKGKRVWVITEWDRSYTTLLLPSEY